MAKKIYGHAVDKAGKVRTVDATLPRHLTGYSPDYDVVTFTEGPFKRLLGRKRK